MYKSVSRSRQAALARGTKRHGVGGGDVIGWKPPSYDAVGHLGGDQPAAGWRPMYEETFKIRKPIRKGSAKRLYLALFTLKSNGAETFLKIGISGLDLDARFQSDRDNYEISILAESRYHTDRDARALEIAFHKFFRINRKRPVVLLASGNTECFVVSDALSSRLKEFVSTV